MIDALNLILQLIVAASAFFVMQTKHKDDCLYSRSVCGIAFMFFGISIITSPTNIANLFFTCGSAIWFIFNIVLYDYFDIFGIKKRNITRTTKG